MGSVNLANVKKTVYYLKRNGLIPTLRAVFERMEEKENTYEWIPVSSDELSKQREQAADLSVGKFSIVVPTYRTFEKYFKEMVDSVLSQSYANLELILVDATPDDSVKQMVSGYTDERIRYHKLEQNLSIAENTNVGIKMATGDYIGLLDHDDLLTPDCLYEVAMAIQKNRDNGRETAFVYTDEDKCDSNAERFYEPHYKEDINQSLLLSNNYICHFTAMRRELMQSLLLRCEYDGAQDFDLVLRAAFLPENAKDSILHVAKVLYHWRCHTGSTAENPESKRYAYEAGKRAVQNMADTLGWDAKAEHTRHLGFYRLVYGKSPLETRTELGAVGGAVCHSGRIVGGRMDENGSVFYENLKSSYSGYMHRAVLQQDVQALDIRNIQIKKELQYLVKELFGVEYAVRKGTDCFDASVLPKDLDVKEAGLKLSEAIRKKGYKLLYMPELPAERV